jgi:catechol 2,3-dioxygenase-like lactoylglutathione lyase family enzyme
MPATKKAKKPARKAARPAPKAPPRFLSVAVVISNRARSVAWYTKKLGLDLVDDADHWQTVGVKGRPGLLHLCRVADYDPDGKLEPGNSGIAFVVPGDFERGCAALAARGVEFSSPPTKAEWGWGAAIKDPDGNEIYLTAES